MSRREEIAVGIAVVVAGSMLALVAIAWPVERTARAVLAIIDVGRGTWSTTCGR